MLSPLLRSPQVQPRVAPDRGFGDGAIRGHGRDQIRSAQQVEPTAVPNIPALALCQGFRNSSGSLAMFAAIRRALVGKA